MKNFVVTIRYQDREIVDYTFEATDAQGAVDAFRAYKIQDPHDIIRVVCICENWS